MNSNSSTSLGLFGSSHIDHYPLDLFKNHNILPHIISSTPKNIAAIKKQDTVKMKIAQIQAQKVELDMILIIIGANDIGNLDPNQIAQGIIEIANSFSKVNIQPIIIPLFNRKNQDT